MDKILEALKIKFPGFSAKQLEVKARSMAKNGKTEADVESVTAESVVEAYADSRTNGALDKLKADHVAATDKLKADHAAEIEKLGGGGAGGDDPKESAAVKEMKEQMKRQQEEMEELKKSHQESAKAKIHKNRLSEIAKMVEPLAEPLRAPYLVGNFADMDDETFNAHKESIQPSIDAAAQFAKGSRMSFQAPPGGGGGAAGQATQDEMDALYPKNG